MFWPRMRNSSLGNTLSDHIDLFNRFFGESFGRGVASTFPAFNVWSSADGAIITSELPGVKLEDLEITAAGNAVRIKGARKEGASESGKYLRRERAAGDFVRDIELPFQIEADKVEARLIHGVLQITLPRAESDKPRKISVNAA